MKIYEYVPKKNTKKLASVTGALLGGAIILVLIYTLLPNPASPWMFQLLAIGMLMLAVFITARYIMKSFTYAIIEENGERLLNVTELQGRRAITVCRLSISGIQTVTVASKNDKASDISVKERIRSEKRKSYNYCSDLFEDKYICIFSEECGEKIAVKLSWEQTLEQVIEDNLKVE